MKNTLETYLPKGKLVPLLCPNEGLDITGFALSLSKTTASRGEKVCVVDCLSGSLMANAGIIYGKTLADVLLNGAKIEDATYVTSNEHFSMMAAGDIDLDHILGSLAAFSLDYDWIYVVMPTGCKPVHTRLAGAADETIIIYNNETEDFLRAYWMIDGIRKRHPRFDACLISMGPPENSAEIAVTLQETIRDFLGAPPYYAGHETDRNLNTRLINHLDKSLANYRIA